MSKEKWNPDPLRRAFVLISAIVILSIAWSVLIFGFPPGMETGAVLFLITPFAMCIIIVEASIMLGRKIIDRTGE